MTPSEPKLQNQPGIVEKPSVQVKVEEAHPWKLILYNDDIHTFDEVINQLIKALRCDISKAEEITLKVHNDGKAIAYEGTFEECFEKNSILLEIQLITEIEG